MLLLAASSHVVFSSPGKEEKVPPSKTFVLVHGAWQAAWVWDAVKMNLEKKGHHVFVVALPGHGQDQTAPQTLSIDVYRDKVVDAVSKANGKVILVGHSLGGVIISSVAEKIPSKIEKLIYVGAFVAQSGQALLDLANTDADSQLGAALRPSVDHVTMDVVNEKLTDIFVQDGPAQVKEQLLKSYRAEPAIPFTNKVTLTGNNYGSVDKIYIKTLQDRVISPALQARMIEAGGIKSVFDINTGHSPFLSKPDALSALLLKVSK